MDKRRNLTSEIAACVLIFVNSIAMVTCTTMFVFSLWVITSPSTLHSAIDATGSPTVKALFPEDALTVHLGVGLAAVSMFLFFISLMGFYGAVTRSTFQLFMYSSLVFLLLLLECALMYYFSTNLLEKGVQSEDGVWAHATRLAFSCCEQNSSFTEANPRPWSCCGAAYAPNNCTSSVFFEKDCRSLIANWLNSYQTTIYVCIAALHVVLSCCSLMRRSRASRSHT